ncbi:hypothetical protein KL941_000791 [Ogataea angusta]|nr:hypothetical protein KL941_000791 [Ogataea angusta]
MLTRELFCRTSGQDQGGVSKQNQTLETNMVIVGGGGQLCQKRLGNTFRTTLAEASCNDYGSLFAGDFTDLRSCDQRTNVQS